MEQVDDFAFKVRGAGGDEICNGHELAIEAWGKERADDDDSALLAMAYLWRRFGPPWRGGDNYKSLVDYTLTTEDPHVFLWLALKGCGLALSVGYLVHESIHQEAHRPMTEWCKRYDDWWYTTHPEFKAWEETEENRRKVRAVYWQERDNEDVLAAARAAIGEIPARVDRRQWRTKTGVVHRVNQAVFGAMKELERPVYVRDCPFNLLGRCADTDKPAEPSRYAGYGVPKAAMDKHFSEDDTQEVS